MATQLRTVEQSAPRATNEEAERMAARTVFVPRTDIYETPDGVVLVSEMPGVAPDALDITLERRVLTIRGHGVGQPHAGYRPIYAEYADGDYERAFTLSEDLDPEHIEAELKNGLLTLTLRKAEPAKARKIGIKAA